MSASTWFRLLGLATLVSTLGFAVPAWTQGKAKGQKVALVIGVTEYDSKNFKPLRFTVNDAEELAKELRKPSAGFASVRVLSNAGGEKDSKDMPTTANIRAALTEMLANRTKHDTVLIALAGHGMQLTVKDPDEKGDPKQYTYFCPSDASLLGISYKSGRSNKLILMDEVFEALGKSDAGHKLALVDACRNEDVVKATQRARPDATKVTIPDGVAALFSCGRGQFAWETDRLGKGHGVFFYHVIEGLRGEAKNTEGEVTWDTLADYVKRTVTRKVPTLIGDGARQTPAAMAGNLEGESPVLALVGKVVEKPKEKDTPGKEMVTKGPLDRDGVNRRGMKFVQLVKGEPVEFLMGASKDEDTDVQNDEIPRHKVKLTKPYYLHITEVTQGQFEAVMGYNPSHFSKDGKGQGAKYGDDQPAGGKEVVKGFTKEQLEHFPVENVSYTEAVSFCEALNKEDKDRLGGWKYSLPTEAQWEYACRGGAPKYKKFHVGDALTKDDANLFAFHKEGYKRL